MECTCYLGVCLPHQRIDPPQRQALTPEHQEMLRRDRENDWPDDKTQYTAAETRLLLDARDILTGLIK